MKKQINILLLSLILIATNHSAFGVIAYPYPIEIIQSDGTKITIILKGDEHVKWAQTVDGYSIMLNSKGVYEYAMPDSKNDMVPSGIKVRNLSERSSSDNQFLNRTNKGLTYSKSQVGIMKSISMINVTAPEKAFPTTGSRNLVCILIGFTDKAFSKTQSDFNNLFNQIGYGVNGATGSVKDYYLENSYNELNLSVTIAGPYMASNTLAYYGANDNNGDDVRPRELVAEAVNLADPDVNYANFDNDNNGSVDGVYVIYAGYGEEAGGGLNCIWAHAWSLSGTLTLDGKSISKYSCSPELSGNSGANITNIGVICHEFGHVLGSPDFYDTDYSTGGQYNGTGYWDLMASGSWNNSGKTPAHHNAYTKTVVYSWASSTVLSSGSQISLNNAAENSNSFYRYNTATTNEYFLIENRQKLKFDASLPGHGMIIYHVDGNYISTAGSNINAGSHQGMYPVCADATGNPPDIYGTINGGGCPFPGTGSKTSFTDITTPNSLSWALNNTAKPISGVTENNTDNTVSFSFMEGVTCTMPTTQASVFICPALTDNYMAIGWTRGTGNSVLVVAREGSAVNEIPANGTAYAYNSAFGNGTQIGAGNYVVYNGSEASINITALKSGTAYYYAIYEYISTSNCYLTPALTANATTTGTPPYCAAGSPATRYEYISNVAIGSINQASGRGTAGYQDFTSQSTTMQIGVNATATITVVSPYSTDQILIWIDWNKDGDFTDLGENVYSSIGTFSSPHTTTNFASPVGATIGTTRMRIRLHDTDYPNVTPCDDASYGEVEDYAIAVTAAACTPPASQATSFTSSAITNTTMTTGWTRGNGNSVLVVAREGSAVNADPVSGTTYTANSAFGSGTQIATGNYVVYEGIGTSVNLTALTGGTSYYYAVYEYSTTNTCYKTPALTGNATTTLLNPPAPPVANPATDILQTSLTANWSSSLTATGFRLDVATNNAFTTFVTGYNDKDVSNVTTYGITGLSANTSYYYRLRAYNTGGTSTNSGIITTITLPNPLSAPVANPATVITQTGFSANWNSSSTAEGYRLDVATNSAFTIFLTGYNDKDVSNVTTYRITGLSANTQYYYRVRAYKTGGTSSNSGIITTITLPYPPSAPVANPATDILQTSLTANWSNSLTATGYRVDVATDNAFTTLVTDFNDKDVSNVTAYWITALSANTPYYYRVRAYNTGGTSTYSGIITTITLPDPPTAPVVNSATDILQTSLTVNWNSLATATGYRVDVATDNTFTTFVTGYNDTDVSNVTTYSITALSANTPYYCRVRAYNSGGPGANSNVITATTLPNPPSAPVANFASNVLQTSLTANWTNSATATGYMLDVATNIGFTTFVTAYNDNDISNITTYSVTGLSANTQYYYRVRAYNTGGTGGSSNIITVSTLTNPSSVPAGLTASSCNDLVTLNWNTSTGSDFLRYRIYGGTTNNPTVKIDSTTNGISHISKLISGLKRGITYNFRVTAVNFDGVESNFSNQSNATVKTGVIPKIKAKWGDVLICYNLGDSITGFQWYKDSSIISNSTNQYYVTNKQTGIYKVETIDKNGCVNSSNAISTSGTKSLSVYPNPASVNFALKLNEVSESRGVIKILTSAGIKVMEFEVENMNDELLKEIPVNNLDEGIYIVQVLLDNKNLFYTKIIVIK
ncbi:MAG: M6 family metalloprotease domain-containing protein [Bacteroidota bacterium]